MATELEIANIALDNLGENDVTSSEYNAGTKTKALKKIKAKIANLKRAFLRLHPWNAAARRSLAIPLYNTLTITVEYPDGTSTEDTLTYQSTDYAYEATNREWVGTDYGFRRDTNGRWWFMDDTLTTPYNYNDNYKSYSCQSPYVFPEKTWNTDWDETDTAVRKLVSISYSDLNDSCRTIHGYSSKVLKPVSYSATARPIRFLGCSSISNRDLRVEGDYIHIGEGVNEFIFIDDIDYEDFDDLMVQAFGIYLAANVTWSIEQDKGNLEALQMLFRKAKSQAATIDSQEDGTYQLNVDAWESARDGYSGRPDRFFNYQPTTVTQR
jgi:hypothetical protein